MLRDLEYLLKVQEIDLKIHEQELAKEQLPATVKELERTIEKAAAATVVAAKKLADAEAELANFEEQIRQAQEGLEKSQSRLNSIKTNREYDAVHSEIETQKNIVATSETRKRKLTEEIANLKKASDEAAAELEKTKSENSPKITELNTQIASIDSVIAGIVKERDAVVPSVGKSTMRTYDLIRKRRKTAKVISMVTSARTCTVCYKVLEPQLVNEIKRSTRITLCQSCGSILVWTGSKPAAAEQKI